MASSQNEAPNQRPNTTERAEVTVEDLHLDRVVASQPEIGPTPPDGGYGWLIVVSAAIYHITVPCVLNLYGLIILRAIKEEDHEEGEALKIWDVDIALMPVIMVVIRLLLESWCRAMVKTFNMPRFMALAGLCFTVAGVLLSSYAADATTNDHIVNVFAGIFAGIGCALTGQQTEVLITHYFRDNLVIAQRLIRMAPSLGNCLVPLLVGYLCTVYTSDAVIMIYAAVVMQNCLFLAAYTRPLYIENVIKHTYNMIRDAVEDDDEVIFSNQNRQNPNPNQHDQNQTQQRHNPQDPNQPTTSQDEDRSDIVVFKSKANAKEIMDPAVQLRENTSPRATEHRFSSDFSTMYSDERTNRFSSDFGSLDVASYSRISGYQELENIDRGQNPQPLYRETTVDTPNSLVFPAEVSPGTLRRTAVVKKNFITVMNMLQDVNFYLYTMLHLTTTYSTLILGIVFPPLVWVENSTLNIQSVSMLVAIAHAASLCFMMLCIAMPKTINAKSKLCTAFSVTGAVGFYGITLSSSRSFLVVWCACAGFATAAASVLLQPLYSSTLGEFDATATATTANSAVAACLMLWTVVYNYEYKTCFWIASGLQITTAFVFLARSCRRRR